MDATANAAADFEKGVGRASAKRRDQKNWEVCSQLT